MRRPHLRRIGAFATLALVGLPIHGRGQAPARPQAAGTVTFRVLGEDGAPMPDLKAADVALKIEGRPREVRSLQFVRFETGTPGTAAPPSPPPPFATNVSPDDRRDLLVLVDEESITSGREEPLRAAIGSLISGVAPADRVSLISMRQGGVNVALTNEHARLKASLGDIRAHSTTRETPSDLMCRTLRMIGTLETVFRSVGSRAPVTIVMFSASAAAMAAGETARIGQETGSDLCQLRLDHFKQLTSAAERSGSSFYVVELTEVGGAQSLPQAMGGLENIAGAAGGEYTRLSGAGEPQMARILRETSGFYVASFDADPSDRPDATRRLEVSVSRPGATVRARKELPATRQAGRKAASPRDMLRTADVFTDLPLRSTAFSTRNAGDTKIKLVVLLEAADGTKLTAAAIGVYDEKGSMKGQWTAQSSDLAQPTVMAALVVAAGKYRMRVAASDGGGRSGTVDSGLNAALIVAGPIGLSDMAFGTQGASGMTPVIQFGAQPSAIAFLELYGRPTAPLGAKVELAATPDGEAIAAVPVAAAASSEPDRFTLTATLPLESLKPGDYIVRATIGVQGQPEGRIVRTLRKTGS